MRIRFAMVPLPMTAAEKFNEAAYFFNQLIATTNNTRTFPFNLSAFLSALRSTTFYLQVQYGHEQRFAEWYGRAQETMKNDPVLKMLKELRTETIHQKPVTLLVNSGPRFHENPIETDHLELTHTTDEEGTIIWRYKVGRDGEERQAEPITEWVFERNGQSVLDACRHGLEQLDTLLREWNRLFGEAGGVEVVG
jgi:hypothetical protein